MKLVLFDIDGTLLNTGVSGIKSAREAIKNLYGKMPPEPELSAVAGKSDKHNFAYMYESACKKKATAKDLESIKDEYVKLLSAEVAAQVKNKKYKVLTGLEAFLKELQKHSDVKLALGTGNVEEAAKIKLTPAGLDKVFVTGGFGWSSTERAVILQNAVKNAQKVFKTTFKADDVYVIGDTHHDIIAAKENGYHNAIVTEAELGDKDRILRAAAELECKNFTDIGLLSVWLGLAQDPKGVEKGSYIMPASAIEHVFFSRTGIDEQRLKMFKIKKYSDLESGKI